MVKETEFLFKSRNKNQALKIIQYTFIQNNVTNLCEGNYIYKISKAQRDP